MDQDNISIIEETGALAPATATKSESGIDSLASPSTAFWGKGESFAFLPRRLQFNPDGSIELRGPNDEYMSNMRCNIPQAEIRERLGADPESSDDSLFLPPVDSLFYVEQFAKLCLLTGKPKEFTWFLPFALRRSGESVIVENWDGNELLRRRLTLPFEDLCLLLPLSSLVLDGDERSSGSLCELSYDWRFASYRGMRPETSLECAWFHFHGLRYFIRVVTRLEKVLRGEQIEYDKPIRDESFLGKEYLAFQEMVRMWALKLEKAFFDMEDGLQEKVLAEIEQHDDTADVHLEIADHLNDYGNAFYKGCPVQLHKPL